MTIRLDRPAPLAVPAVASPARPASAVGRALLVAVNLAAVTSFLLSYSRHGIEFGQYRIDLDVYRIGGDVWLRHGDLYGTLPPTSNGVRLLFTYPPAAAVLLSPLSLVPMTAAGTVLSLATVALTAVVLRLFLRSAAGPASGSWWTIGWLLPVALLLEPVRHTLGYGQVNVLLMAMVSADCLPATTRWPRGLLTGIAAAVKLTPAAFVLFFLCRGDRRAAATAAVTFVACGAAGFPLAWHDSVRYWTSAVFQTSRPGSLANAANQSIQAVLLRAGADPHAPAGMALWLGLSAVVVVLAWHGMRRALARSADAWALSLNAFAALLISPVSWSHHWVWAGPALLVLAIDGLRDRRRGALAGAAAGLAVFVAAPQWWFPTGADRETHWAIWQQAAGASYVILAVVILLVSAPPRFIWQNDMGASVRSEVLRSAAMRDWDPAEPDLSLAWDAAEQHGVTLLRQALPDARRWPAPVADLTESAARIRSAGRRRPYKQLARAAWGGARPPADDARLWLEAAGAMATMRHHIAADVPWLAPVSVLRPADWAGAVIGMVRSGANSSVTPGHLVDYARQSLDVGDKRAADELEVPAYDPFASVAEDDESLLRAFQAALLVWEAVGAVSEQWWLTGLGWWGLPRALALAWNGDFDADSDWADATPPDRQERVWAGDAPDPEALGIHPPPLTG